MAVSKGGIQTWFSSEQVPSVSHHVMIWKMLKTARSVQHEAVWGKICASIRLLYVCNSFFFFFPVRPLFCRGLPCAQIPFLASASWARLIRRLEWDPEEGGHPHVVLPTNVLQWQGSAELMDLRRGDPASHGYKRQVSFSPGRYCNAIFRCHKPQNGVEVCPVL